MNTIPPQPIQYYANLPKVELHRHLEGSVRLATLLDVGRASGMNLPKTGELRELVQMGSEEEYSYDKFLSKFQTLRLFYRSPEIIERVTIETIADAAADHILYMELRFTPVALSRAEGFPLGEVMDWVIGAVQKGEQQYGVKTRLIAGVNRHEDVSLAEKVVELAAERRDRGLLGLDLAGNEAQFSSRGFLGVFKEARQAGLHVTIHAGEWAGAENVMDAILYLNADRIGHGVRVLEDPDVTALARDRGIPFEVCVTSNYQSGVVPSLTVHPLTRMLAHGLNVTINTDDPSVSQITLGSEYSLVCEELGLSREVLHQRVVAAAQASFLPEDEKAELVRLLGNEFPQP
ncbi:MAG: adenosine deaminase [Anaerolineales bacterium]|nr:adenosine deaminase [Anaerolineales bacterium]